MNNSDLTTCPKYLKFLEQFITVSRNARFNRVLSQRTKHFCVVTEDLYQMHNTSAVMRSCDVFGIQDLHVIEQRFGKDIDKEIALGAEKWVDIYRHRSTINCINTLKSKGYQIVATTPHIDAHLLHDFDIQKPSAIFFGTEQFGVSEEVMKAADTFIKIPMYGFTESLNISVAAAIVVNHITTELRRSNVHWQLSKDEQLIKKIEWVRKSIKNIDFITNRYISENNL